MTVVVAKMFHVLDCIATDENDVVGLARLTKRTQIPKATLHRLLCDLADSGLVDHRPGGYSLGTQLFVLGNAVPRYKQLRCVSLPHLEHLNRQTSDTVHLTALHDTQGLVLEKVHGLHRVRIPTTVGSRVPLHSTAMGKALLAFERGELADRVLGAPLQAYTKHTLCAPGLLDRQLRRCQQEGVAVESEEMFAGVGCVAAPILDVGGNLIGSISVSGDPASRRSQLLIRQVKGAAADISKDLSAALAA